MVEWGHGASRSIRPVPHAARAVTGRLLAARSTFAGAQVSGELVLVTDARLFGAEGAKPSAMATWQARDQIVEATQAILGRLGAAMNPHGVVLRAGVARGLTEDEAAAAFHRRGPADHPFDVDGHLLLVALSAQVHRDDWDESSSVSVRYPPGSVTLFEKSSGEPSRPPNSSSRRRG